MNKIALFSILMIHSAGSVLATTDRIPVQLPKLIYNTKTEALKKITGLLRKNTEQITSDDIQGLKQELAALKERTFTNIKHKTIIKEIIKTIRPTFTLLYTAYARKNTPESKEIYDQTIYHISQDIINGVNQALKVQRDGTEA